jgi:hypothetical protein
MAVVAILPFALHPASLLTRHYDAVALSGFAVIAMLILWIAAGSFFNALEFFLLQGIPAIAFHPEAMFVRRVGRKALSEIRYSDIEQFYIEEREGRSSVSRFLLVTVTDGSQLRIPCDALGISPQDLQKALIESTPEISYRSERG